MACPKSVLMEALSRLERAFNQRNVMFDRSCGNEDDLIVKESQCLKKINVMYLEQAVSSY